MRFLTSIALITLACRTDEAGVQAPAEIVREVTTGIRAEPRVQLSVKASAEEPTSEDLDLRRRIEERIEQENIGRLVSSGGGAGYVDIVVDVENTAEAIPRMQAMLRDMEIARHSSFKVIPPAP